MNYSYLQWVILASVLIPSVIADIKERKVCLGLIVCGFAAGILYTAGNGMPPFLEYFLRFLPGIAILTAAYLVKGCIGIGDGLMCIFLATLLETKYVFTAILAGFVIAAIAGICMMLLKKLNGKSKLPFIPFLTMGVVICGVV